MQMLDALLTMVQHTLTLSWRIQLLYMHIVSNWILGNMHTHIIAIGYTYTLVV